MDLMSSLSQCLPLLLLLSLLLLLLLLAHSLRQTS